MNRPALALAFALPVLACSARAAPGADLLDTPECLAARQQLEQVLSARGPHDRLLAVRREAALRCFGTTLPDEPAPPAAPSSVRLKAAPAASAASTAPRPKNRVLPPPVAIEPIPLRSSRALLPPAEVPPAPPPPLAISRPTVITTCDAAGCWDSEGRRHNQQGPVLVGPQGICTQQGGLLNCP